MTIHNSLSELIGNTPLVKLNHVTDGIKATIAVKVEYLNPGGSSKDRIAERIIDAAEKSGQLKPGGVIVEPTSGNTGVGLALVALQRGYRAIFTLPDKVSKAKRAVLRAYGAEVVVTPTDAGPDDPRSYYQVAERLAKTIPGGYRPNQYDNPNGPESHYRSTGPEIWQATDHQVTHFVAGIGTGGTIASEMTPDGLTPELNTEQLLEFIPDIGKLCLVDCLQLYSLDSTNIRPENWLGIVEILRKSYDVYDGFVISHGTDTMAYTAAALSYLVQGSAKPIVLTGAQKPIWFDGTDSKRNLTDAFLYACRGCGGVQIVFNGKVILGTRARKTFSKSFQAFSSVNYPDLAVLQDERLLQYIRTESLPRPVFYDKLCENVGLLKLIPGTSSQLIDFMLDRSDGLIIESFGVGGLPEYHGSEFYDAVRRGVERGKIVVMTTQVPNEGSDLTVYHVGGRLKSTLRLLEAYDMTTESAVAKLMWILGQTRDFDEAERLFYRPVARDILCENES